METLEPNHSTVLQNWRIVKSPPLSGVEIMQYDADLLTSVSQGTLAATLRFFRFKEPTVSFGRLQKWTNVASLVPLNWTAVQRPTGGGIVFHKSDLCISLCWPHGQSPLPTRPQDVYRWIHAVIRDGLMNDQLTMASCRDTCDELQPFAVRECFSEPVGHDLLEGNRKVVGGALRWTREAVLYQGSLHRELTSTQEDHLLSIFQNHLNSCG